MPKVEFAQCPIRTSLGVLGKKWTILILSVIGFHRINRFNRILESIPGLTPRVLSKRLNELEEEGFIECIQNQKSPMVVRWTLTEKGMDTVPMMIHLIAFSSKWHASEVFKDKTPRSLHELFKPEAIEIMREI